MNDVELIGQIVPLWYEKKKWAEDLIVTKLNLSHPQDILKPENRGDKKIPSTEWHYRTHGVGIDIYLSENEDSGGIDFDFDKPDPDGWRLRIFFEKQYIEGSLDKATFKELFEDRKRFEEATTRVLGHMN